MEFSNDGIRDSLTGVMSPSNFYDSAARLLSWSRRRGEPLSLIGADLSGLDADSIIKISRDVLAELRGGDLLTRLGVFSLTLLVIGDEKAAGHLIFRLENVVKPQVNFHFVTLKESEDVASGLSRLGM